MFERERTLIYDAEASDHSELLLPLPQSVAFEGRRGVPSARSGHFGSADHLRPVFCSPDQRANHAWHSTYGQRQGGAPGCVP